MAEDLLKSLWDNVDHPRKPPRGRFTGALSHDIIHVLNMIVALST
ncbi:hypothetical protein [Nocardia sp. 2TAF39]